MVFGSGNDSLDSVRDRRLCIAVYLPDEIVADVTHNPLRTIREEDRQRRDVL
jgi:hypothetical protein